MPRWFPSQRWAGSDVFIIGGGPSLRSFDFGRLRDKHTIGCNSAFLLGAELCNVCFFSDEQFFVKYADQLEQFAGPVVTHCEEMPWNHPWLLKMERREGGLHRDAIGYGYNSGCSAVNLALLFGARRVILLGFDCQLGAQGQTHWHNRAMEQTHPDIFPKFMEGWRMIARTLPDVFPGCEVLNTAPSTIDCFPFININEVL